ncbi:BTAD domain-containing putative transcriptional regulator [Spirillospora sp. NPDC047279]|uniref:AfsR/SARP family transcriptional regulator n=1 Tax=Spirillospora sp. NPDC047279 TaxID=3155478 RepID=UPI003400576B
MSGPLYFRVLGPVVAERNGEPLDVGGPQPRTVLGLLLLEAGRVVPVDRLVEALWESEPPNSWRVQLQGMVSRLRRTLGTGGERTSSPIDTVPPGYRLSVSDGQLDLMDFRREVDAARRHVARGEPAPAADLLHAALDRWRGQVCADIPSRYVRQFAADLEDLRLAAIEDRIDADISLGRHDGLAGELQALVREHPLRERFGGQLMSVLSRAGRPADALGVFRDVRERLVADLGIEPSTRLQQLHRAILTGVHGAEDAEAARGLPYVVPRQLPADVTDHVGREDVLAELSAVLAAAPRAAPPRIAITGPGGIGKTALALRLAHLQRAAYPDGQLYARIGRTEAAHVLAMFLHALGVPPAGVPQALDERSSLLRELLATRRVLLVLDDVQDEGRLRPLLPAEPRCAVVVTSRRRLSGDGTLRVVALDALPDDEGLRLFGAIAGPARAAAEPRAAAEIIRLCGGMPLAIRIAAGRLRSRPDWTVGDMARRLASRRDRLDWLKQGDVSVRTTFEDSYEVLDPDHRRLFRHLGLLETPEFPAWLPGALLDDPDAAERLLDDLVDVHLVEPAGRGVTGPRYRLHDLIHLMAAELADPAGRAAALSRVLHGWRDLADTADAELPHWYGLDPAPEPAWRAPAHLRDAVCAAPLAWFDEERVLLSAQVSLAEAEPALGVAWPLAQNLTTCFDLRGRYEEWGAVLHSGLRAAERAGDDRGVACMLGLLVDCETSRFEFGVGLQYAERTMNAYQALPPGPAPPPPEPHAETGDPQWRALAAARAAGDPVGVARYAFTLCLRRRDRGERGGYLALLEEAATAFRACEAPISELWALKTAWLAYLKQGRIDEAVACLDRGLVIVISMGADFETSSVVGEIGERMVAAGRFDEAAELAGETLHRARRHGHHWDEAAALDVLAALAYASGDHHAAIDAYLKSLALWRRLKTMARVTDTMARLAALLDEAGHDAAHATLVSSHGGGAPA